MEGLLHPSEKEMDEEYSRLVIDSFHCSDEEGKGFLSKEDYKVAIIQLFGYKPSKYELSEIWSSDATDARLQLDQFKSIVFPRLLRRDHSEHIRQIFLAFDRFCHGFISLEDCKAAFLKILPHMSVERIGTFFKEIDSDLDGRVSYRDFEMLMKSLMLPVGRSSNN